jgi:hypothetical protein
MPINFLYPDPSKDKIMDELDKLVSILQKPKTPELKRNIRIVRNFTKALFIVSHKKLPVRISKQPITQQPLPTQQKAPLPPPPPAPKEVPKTLPNEEIPQNTITQLKKEGDELKYNSIEPVMQSLDWKIYNHLRPIVKEALKKDPKTIEDQPFLEKEIKKITKELKIEFSNDYIKKIKYYLTKNMKGFGKVDPLIKDERVKKIICNSYSEIKVIFENETLKTNIKFDSNEGLNNFIEGLAEKYGKEVSDSNPKLELKLPNMEIKADYNPLTTSSFVITKL